jgi:phage shock protein A
MKETVYSRVRRIIRSSIRQWIEGFEDISPQEGMEKAIGEVQDVIETVRGELGKTLADKYLTSKRLSEAEEQHKSVTAQIESALREGRNNAAESAISRQLDIEDQISSLKSQIISFEEKKAELENFITALQLKRHEMKEELTRFRQYGSGGNSAYGLQSKISQAELSFTRAAEEQT